MQGGEDHRGPWTEQEPSRLGEHQSAENGGEMRVDVFKAAFEIRTPQAAPLAVTGTSVETLNLGEVGEAGMHCSWLGESARSWLLLAQARVSSRGSATMPPRLRSSTLSIPPPSSPQNQLCRWNCFLLRALKLTETLECYGGSPQWMLLGFPLTEAFQFYGTESHCWITVFTCALCVFTYYFNYFAFLCNLLSYFIL